MREILATDRGKPNTASASTRGARPCARSSPQTGVCTLDLLDKPPSTELEVEETKTEAEVEEATQLLASVPGPLFSCLAPEFQDRLIKSMTFAEYDEGAVISEQGQPVT